tara:strand:+ start:434 stop:910 length:477 start_codon:yes stop_codon:yes gene_type:complete
MQNKGYFDSSKWHSFTESERKLQVYTVICNNCNATWEEEIQRLTSTIAGYARRYDFCSLCEQNYTKNHGRMSSLNLKAYGIGLDPKDNPKSGSLNPKSPTLSPIQGFGEGLNPIFDRFKNGSIDKGLKPPKWTNPKLGHEGPIDPTSQWADSANGEIT